MLTMKTTAVRRFLILGMLVWLTAFPPGAYCASADSPSVAATSAAKAPPAAAGSREIEIPDWFKASFLNLPEDVQEASQLDRRVMLFFTQDGCSYCKKMVEVSFTDPAVLSLMKKHFDAIALNIHGSLDVTWIDGKRRSEKDLARKLGIAYTPTLLFLDEKGNVALRLTGFSPPEKLIPALDYVALKLEGKMTLPQYLASACRAAKGGPAERDPALSPSPYVVVIPVKGEFTEVKDRVTMAIENQGLVITSTAHVGDMLDRTGKDIGRAVPIYQDAEVYEFCSARISRDAMEAEPRNIVYCPYTIAVYSMSDRPATSYIAYRKPRPTGSVRSMGALKAVGQLLDAIARDALD